MCSHQKNPFLLYLKKKAENCEYMSKLNFMLTPMYFLEFGNPKYILDKSKTCHNVLSWKNNLFFQKGQFLEKIKRWFIFLRLGSPELAWTNNYLHICCEKIDGVSWLANRGEKIIAWEKKKFVWSILLFSYSQTLSTKTKCLLEYVTDILNNRSKPSELDFINVRSTSQGSNEIVTFFIKNCSSVHRMISPIFDLKLGHFSTFS